MPADSYPLKRECLLMLLSETGGAGIFYELSHVGIATYDHHRGCSSDSVLYGAHLLICSGLRSAITSRARAQRKPVIVEMTRARVRIALSVADAIASQIVPVGGADDEIHRHEAVHRDLWP
jgi:hypothetical protein